MFRNAVLRGRLETRKRGQERVRERERCRAINIDSLNVGSANQDESSKSTEESVENSHGDPDTHIISIPSDLVWTPKYSI